MIKRKKILSLSLALAMMCTTLLGTGVTAAADDTLEETAENESMLQAADDKTAYFSVNMFDYDTTNINRSQTNARGTFFFNNGQDNNYAYNRWTGNGGSPTFGIAEDTLDANGNINIKYDNIGILDPTTSANGKYTYTNVQVPFQYNSRTGYYELNSATYDVHFQNRYPSSNATLTGSSRNGYGFFPFYPRNSYSENRKSNIHFGMTFSTEFFMTENGKINGDENGQPISFEFTGDDDVWVFIDGKLVLDIGGIHDAVQGAVNFATGDITYRWGNRNYADEQNLWTTLGTSDTEWRSSTTPHTLQVFYLERGGNLSNCRIKFNLPQKRVVSLTKAVTNTVSESDTELKNKLNDLEFEFTAYKKSGKNTSAEPFAGTAYYVYNSNNKLVKTGTTSADGKFSMKGDQRVSFYIEKDLYDDTDPDYVYFVESQEPQSVTSWEAVGLGSNTINKNGHQSPELEIAKATAVTKGAAAPSYRYVCKNEVVSEAHDDLVVLDYGRPVDIDVLKNDILNETNPRIGGIREYKSEISSDGAEVDISDDPFAAQDLGLSCGTAAIEAGTKIRYTPNTFMDQVDTLQYVVGNSAAEGNAENIAKVTILPATSVYYEDNFSSANGKTVIKYSGDYSANEIISNEVQSSENTVYGYDASYEDQKGFSDDGATAMENGAEAEFTFKGTGVEIFTKTDTSSPKIYARIYMKNDDDSETLKKILYVDNMYDRAGDGLYVVPTLSFVMDEHAEYKVKLKVFPNTKGEKTTYYLDGIRIHNPIDVDDKENPDSAVAYDAYNQAFENEYAYANVRDVLLSSINSDGSLDVFNDPNVGDVDEESASGNGVVYLDNVPYTTADASVYEKDGPKNEVYLSNPNCIAFTIAGYSNTSNHVFIGLKAPEGKSTRVKVTNDWGTKSIDVTSTAELYYPITPTSDGHVVIQNEGNNLLAITEIRVTGVTEAQKEQLLNTGYNTLDYAATFSQTEPDADSHVEGTTISADSVDVIIQNNTTKRNSEILKEWTARVVSAFTRVFTR
ncbi:MAG: fibro-slime domain-containing protein [Eubacteriales bacterium]|nr:fibro-slime domain-containing protein [Eubacteriales bacterium]